MAYQEFTTPGTSSFTVPAGVTSITIECIGGGGKGGSAAGLGLGAKPGFGSGGAGGSYAKKTISTIPGTVYCVVVGNNQNAKDTYFGRTGFPSFVTQSNTVLVCAEGGRGGQNIDNIRDCVAYGQIAYGSTANSIGDVLYRGGNGGGFIFNVNNPKWFCGGTTTSIIYEAGSGKQQTITFSNCDPLYSGPGGGGAGATGPGGDANICSGSLGGIGNSPGGNGGNGVAQGNPGNIGSQYGGGGAGAGIRGVAFGVRQGGAGYQGYVKISWNTETLTCRPLYTSAACCPIAIGCNVYSDPQLTTTAPNGYYWDGTQCWIVLNGVINSIGSCGTTTSTTTTTTTVSGYYYTVTQYICPDCSLGSSLTAFSPVARTIGNFYGIGDGYAYEIVSETSGPGYSVDLTGAASGGSCFSICIT